MAAASLLRIAIQICILPIIGRLLGPVAYGQIALVTPFIFFAMLLAESGLGACIVRADEVSSELQGSIFCFSAGFSLLIIALFATIAYPVGRWINEPAFPALLLGMSSILLLASLNIVPASILLRDKRYGWIALSDFASSIGGVGAVILGITLGWGAWSLVAQQIMLWVCKIVVVTIGARWRPRLIFRWQVVKEHFAFGSNLTCGSIVQFVARNIDNILIGAFMGTETLGYYALAWQINSLPGMILSGSVYYTVFSRTSEMHRSGTFSPEPFLRTLRTVLLISAPAMVGLAVTASLSVPLIVGDKWLPVVPLIRYLATMGLCQTINAAISGLLIGRGLSALSLRLGILTSITTIAVILIGVAINSQTVAAGISIAAVIGLYATLRAVTKECTIDGQALAKMFVPPLTTALLMGIVVYIFQQTLLLTEPYTLRLLASILIGIGSYVVLMFTLFHNEIAADLESLKMLLRPNSTSHQRSL